MNAAPLVTIMIPTCNQEAYIREAVESALAQDYPNLEIIAADDCSADSTPAILKELQKTDTRLTVVENRTKLGRCGNYRNLLYRLASGDWVINLDGDDFFTDRSFVSRFLHAAQVYPEAVLIFGDLANEENPHRRKSPRASGPHALDGTGYVLKWPGVFPRIQHAVCLYRRKEAVARGFYSLDILSSDYESLFKLALGSQIVYVPGAVAVWRKHSNNLSAEKDPAVLIANFKLFESTADFAQRLLPGLPREKLERWKRRNIRRKIYTGFLFYKLAGEYGMMRLFQAKLKESPYRRDYFRARFSPVNRIKIRIHRLIRQIENFRPFRR